MSQFNTYDPSLVLLSFAGIPIRGYAPGTFIEVEHNEDTFKQAVGATGDVTRVRSQDNTGMVTVTLMAGSPTNDSLSAQYALDKLSGAGHGSLGLVDTNGTSNVECEHAWINKLPKLEFSDDGTDRVWVFFCADLEVLVGGNTTVV